MLEPDGPQMIIRHTRFAFRVTKAADTHWEYVILIGFALQQFLRERALRLHYTYIACRGIHLIIYINISATCFGF
jgi:hypothetical protein